ncbi:T9SS C-terminal target domain-containing protein [Bacteroides sp. 214]|uniref:CotH kinase family protein n=1 Tax=Bacteroides sp. 214 TaxID=2302935 RepID=UPI0013D243F7|nr:CotH kinase family protein [Bacteroides sp. 214]NDW12737.1 T9SS C-terminal target domain-containing protein [Bacteroides sp. 214]
MRKKILLIGSCCLTFLLQSQDIFAQKPGDLFINEISLCNVSKDLTIFPRKAKDGVFYPDTAQLQYFDYAGWIELYNPTDSEFKGEQIYFSDDANTPLKYRIYNSRPIPPKSYVSYWFDIEMEDSKAEPMDLDSDGGYISIANNLGVRLDEVFYPKQYTDVSYGRIIDGSGEWAYLKKTTLNSSNNLAGSASFPVETPIISTKSGFYSDKVEITLSCATLGAKIYYTLDSTNPDESRHLYTQPIVIEKTTTLRAKAFHEDYLEGLTISATYMINERKPDLPVVFMAIDTAYLYNDTIGIYCIGKKGISGVGGIIANYNRDWTRYGYFELINEDGTINISRPVGYEISGNASKNHEQKAFKVKATSKYGSKRMDFDFFKDKTGRRFKSILLRQGGQQYIGLCYLKDAVLQSLANVTPLAYQAYLPTVVYINGKYWGLYNIRERSNDDNIYSNYGCNKNEIDLIDHNWVPYTKSGNTVEYNKLQSFYETNDLSNQEAYNTISQMIDVDNFLYYMATEILLNNEDWGNNNQKMFLCKRSDEKWRWILNDLDNSIKSMTGDKLKELLNSSSSRLSTKLIVNLLKNETFKNRYIDVLCISAASIYTPNRISTKMYNAWSVIKAEYPYSYDRWSGLKSNPEGEIASMINNATGLNEVAFDNLQTHFNLGAPTELTITSNHEYLSISFNNERIPILPYEGKYFEGRELTLTAPLYDSWKKFARWEIYNGDQLSKTEAATELKISLTEATRIVAVYEPADLVRRSGLFINEISASNAIFVDNAFKYEDWVEIYNGSDESIDLAGYYFSNVESNLKLWQIPSDDNGSTIVPAHGYAILWCSKAPERGVMHTNFKLPKTGGTLYLSKDKEDGGIEIIDEVTYPVHTEYTSHGRYPDGSETLVYFDYPTFKKANQHSSYNIVDYVEDYSLVTDISEISTKGNKPTVYTSDNRTLLNINSTEERVATVYSLNGHIIEQVKLSTGHNSINISKYATGLYVLLLEGNAKRDIYKFIK